jgi:hypothetical protein
MQGTLTLYAIRWLMPRTPEGALEKFLAFPKITYSADSYQFGYLESIFVPMLVYLLWQSLYCYFILDLNREKVHGA